MLSSHPISSAYQLTSGLLDCEVPCRRGAMTGAAWRDGTDREWSKSRQNICKLYAWLSVSA